MANFHFRIKSGAKGTAADHAAYITGQHKHRGRGDLVWTAFGNMPTWAEGDPETFWRTGDRHERANGAVYREHEISLPAELTLQQLHELVDNLIREMVGNKPYQYAVHAPDSSFEGPTNIHLHLMFSDRMDDGIERTAEQTFNRYNAKHPGQGGWKKDSGGRSPLTQRDETIEKRRKVAELENAALAKAGHATRVDHRSLKQQGVNRKPERYLGAAIVRKMSPKQKAEYIAARKARGS